MPVRRVALGMRICAVLFALLSLTDVWEVWSTLAGWNEEPDSILVIHCVLFVVTVVTAVGLWRAARWSVAAVMVWGLGIAAFIVGLGPLLSLDAEARSGLWVGGMTMLAFAIAIAFYARRHVRVTPPLDAPPTVV